MRFRAELILQEVDTASSSVRAAEKEAERHKDKETAAAAVAAACTEALEKKRQELKALRAEAQVTPVFFLSPFCLLSPVSFRVCLPDSFFASFCLLCCLLYTIAFVFLLPFVSPLICLLPPFVPCCLLSVSFSQLLKSRCLPLEEEQDLPQLTAAVRSRLVSLS